MQLLGWGVKEAICRWWCCRFLAEFEGIILIWDVGKSLL